jgi:DNA processing protein
MDSREALVALNLISDVGPIMVRNLLDQFGSGPAVLRASVRDLIQVDRVGPATAEAIVRWEKSVDLAGELQRIRDFECRIITNVDDEYPPLLREIYDPPIVLYAHGELTARDRHAVAMVGTRMATQYGRAMAGKLAGQLARAGFTIISGGARGVDTASHEGALAAGGRTIAVLGTGLDIVYPSENADLFKRIPENGAVITQFPFGRRGDKQSFPIRNRIVAGMARATVVVEANRASGALITANFAGEYGRAVFAVPGRIDNPRSAGCHDLIRDGAQLCGDADHVLEEFDQLFGSAASAADDRPMPELSEQEKTIYGVLSHEERGFDEIVGATRLPVSEVNVGLLQLELKRLAKQLPGRLFMKTR